MDYAGSPIHFASCHQTEDRSAKILDNSRPVLNRSSVPVHRAIVPDERHEADYFLQCRIRFLNIVI